MKRVCSSFFRKGSSWTRKRTATVVPNIGKRGGSVRRGDRYDEVRPPVQGDASDLYFQIYLDKGRSETAEKTLFYDHRRILSFRAGDLAGRHRKKRKNDRLF